jgi:hypothetical protein
MVKETLATGTLVASALIVPAAMPAEPANAGTVAQSVAPGSVPCTAGHCKWRWKKHKWCKVCKKHGRWVVRWCERNYRHTYHHYDHHYYRWYHPRKDWGWSKWRGGGDRWYGQSQSQSQSQSQGGWSGGQSQSQSQSSWGSQSQSQSQSGETQTWFGLSQSQ